MRKYTTIAFFHHLFGHALGANNDDVDVRIFNQHPWPLVPSSVAYTVYTRPSLFIYIKVLR